MKTQSAHAHEDRLLDFAYDELPLSEAQAVEQHVQGCSRCAETLQGIRGVRRSMARLPREEAPVEGLDSLLAYAEQSARRAAAGAEPAPRWWRRLMAPALSMAAVSVLGVVVLQVNEESVPTAVTQIAFKSQEGSARLVESPAPAPPAPAASAPAADSFAEADSSGMAVEDEERAPPSKSKYKSAPAMRTGVARGEARRERSKKMALREEPSAVGGAPSS
ncbi:MAG: zf-HC2 domain-containing protein, partial [Cystobacter sp.]